MPKVNEGYYRQLSPSRVCDDVRLFVVMCVCLLDFDLIVPDDDRHRRHSIDNPHCPQPPPPPSPTPLLSTTTKTKCKVTLRIFFCFCSFAPIVNSCGAINGFPLLLPLLLQAPCSMLTWIYFINYFVFFFFIHSNFVLLRKIKQFHHRVRLT